MLSEKSWSAEGVAQFFFGLLVCVAAGGVVGHLLWQWEAVHRLGSKDFFSMLVASVSLHGATLGLAHWFLRFHGVGWRQGFGIRRQGIVSAIGWAVVLTILVIPGVRVVSELIALGMEWVGIQPEKQSAVKALESTVALPQQVVFGLVAMVLAPFSEELIFRGILYPAVKEMGYPRMALWSTALVFGLIHANLMTLIPLTLLAVIWTLLYEHTDNLMAPVLAHALFNATNFFSLLRLQG